MRILLGEWHNKPLISCPKRAIFFLRGRGGKLTEINISDLWKIRKSRPNLTRRERISINFIYFNMFIPRVSFVQIIQNISILPRTALAFRIKKWKKKTVFTNAWRNIIDVFKMHQREVYFREWREGETQYAENNKRLTIVYFSSFIFHGFARTELMWT